jgi:hypothetical protein
MAMRDPAPLPLNKPRSVAGSFLVFLFTGLLWCVVGAFAGRYLFPETVEKVVIQTVEKVVTQRVEVPVEKVVIKEVIKEVEKIVEVPVEKIVIKEISVPVPMKPETRQSTKEEKESPWDFIREGLSKSDVTALLGDPRSVHEEGDKVTWYYEEKGQGVLFVRFKAGGLFGSDTVDLWLAPDRRPLSKDKAGARLQGMALKAIKEGNAPLALVYAQSALDVEPDSDAIKELVRELLIKVRAQTPPR